MNIEKRDDEAGSLVVTTNPAGSLNVLCVGLWLAEHDHQSEALDVEARGKSCSLQSRNPLLPNLVEWRLESTACLGHLVGGNA